MMYVALADGGISALEFIVSRPRNQAIFHRHRALAPPST